MVTVASREKWNDTGVDVVQGKTYHYQATGRWKDWYIPCDANGFSRWWLFLFGRTKRVPSARWLQLIGVVNKDMSCTIKLGTDGSFIAPQTGRLWVFANDAGVAYGNNSGSIAFDARAE